MVLMFSSYCSWDICRGALTPVITYWLKLASIVAYLNFSCLILCCCRPVASVYLHLKRNLSNSFKFVDFHLMSILCGNLQSLWLVGLAVTLSVTMLDSWCFNAKYANYLHGCYDQFLWSLSFLLKWLVWSHFNIIIVWFVTTYPLGFSGRILQSSMFSYLVSYLHILTFLQLLQLVVVVVDCCLNFLS